MCFHILNEKYVHQSFTYNILSRGVVSSYVLKTILTTKKLMLPFLCTIIQLFKCVSSCAPHKAAVIVWENDNMPHKYNDKVMKFCPFVPRPYLAYFLSATVAPVPRFFAYFIKHLCVYYIHDSI